MRAFNGENEVRNAVLAGSHVRLQKETIPGFVMYARSLSRKIRQQEAVRPVVSGVGGWVAEEET